MAEKSMAERKRSPASQLRTIKKAYSRERRTKKLGIIKARPEEKKERKEKRSCKPFHPEGPVDVGPVPRTLAAGCIPITGITDGIIHTGDGRYVKIVEVMPVNFLLRSPVEQRNIIYSFIGYLKIAPVKLQIKVLSKKADISGFLENIRKDKEKETDERCRLLQEDYASLIRSVGSREAISRRFFLIFEYETYRSSRSQNENDIVAVLNTAVQTAKKYLSQCGNEVIIPEHDTQACVEVLYHILNRRTSTMKTLNQHMNEVVAWYIRENGEESVENIPITEFFAPESIDFKHGNYIVMDGIYHTYLFIPSAGYRSRVPAGWLSLLVNAGEGIDIDVFLYKQDKAKSVERIGRRIRLNSSKIKEVSDTNSNYDDLAESIQAGAMPILGDVYEVLMEKAETKRLANILNRMVHGSASSFNQQTNVDLSNKYVVLDISELSGDLLTVGMFVALDFVWSKAKEDRTVEKAIFIDEVWKLIGAASNEMAAEYVLEIFKIIRGYGGSGVCATQDLTDFFALKDGKYGRGIINNAKTKIILNMENNEAEQIKEVLHLSEAEMMSIVRFERGNGMISTNNNNLTVEFRASQLEKDLITTDRKDLKELRERLERYGKGAMGKRFDDA